MKTRVGRLELVDQVTEDTYIPDIPNVAIAALRDLSRGHGGAPTPSITDGSRGGPRTARPGD